MGVEHVIDRKAEGYQFWNDEHDPGPGRVAPARQEDPRARRHRPRHRVRAPRSLDDGRVGVRAQARRHDHHLRGDERLHDRVRQPLPLDEPEDAQGLSLRELPRGVGGEPARSCEGKIHPTLSAVFPFEEIGEAAYQVHHNLHEGKLGVLVLAPEEGLGVTDPEMRERLLPQITLFRRHA